MKNFTNVENNGMEKASVRVAPTVYFSLKNNDKLEGITLAQSFEALGFDLYATGDMAHVLNMNMVAASTAHSGHFTFVVTTGEAQQVTGDHVCHSLQEAMELLAGMQAKKSA